MGIIQINRKLQIPDSEIEWSYVRSSGPGGQNVNRTNSCAVLRWNYLESKSLQLIFPSNTVLNKLKALATNEGDIIVRSQAFRDQERNYQECIEKFVKIITQTFHIPKKRIATKPTHSSKKKRLQSKKLHADKKNLRQKGYED
jgi:ribosome-associated protein